jgi:hypothetical protein
MSRVNEFAIYQNYAPIPLNSKVSIIPAEFTRLNTNDFTTNSTDDTKFVNGTLIKDEPKGHGGTKNELVLSGGHGGINKYVVKLDNPEDADKLGESSDEIEFLSSPRKYYFKVNPAPSRGGKKSRRKRNKKRTRKNRRKSRRRH